MTDLRSTPEMMAEKFCKDLNIEGVNMPEAIADMIREAITLFQLGQLNIWRKQK